MAHKLCLPCSLFLPSVWVQFSSALHQNEEISLGLRRREHGEPGKAGELLCCGMEPQLAAWLAYLDVEKPTLVHAVTDIEEAGF